MEKLAMSESGGRRWETHFARGCLHQGLSREGLNKAPLPVTTGSEYDALGRRCGASYDYYVDRSLLARVFTGRSSSLHCARHLRELFFLFSFWQRANLLFVMLFCCHHIRHERAVENSADGFHIRDLRMVLEPHGVGKSAPGQGKLCLDRSRDHGFVAGGALPRLKAVLFEVEGFGLDYRKNCLRGTEGGNAFEQGD